MILSSQSIKDRCLNQKMLEPFAHKTIYNGVSYGLSSAGYDVRIAQSVVIAPRGFVLASTYELFKIPKDIMAFVHDKSTWARLGLSIFNTVIEPGWSGYLTLELSNQTYEQISIKEGTAIAQIIFHQLDMDTDTPYAGKYQNQRDRPQEAILEKDN